MSDKDQTEAFAAALDRLVVNFSQEFDLTNAQVVGVLQIKVHCICQQAIEQDDND